MVYRLQVGEAQYAMKIHFDLEGVFRDLAEQYHVSVNSAVTDELQENSSNANLYGIYWDRGSVRRIRF